MWKKLKELKNKELQILTFLTNCYNLFKKFTKASKDLNNTFNQFDLKIYSEQLGQQVCFRLKCTQHIHQNRSQAMTSHQTGFIHFKGLSISSKNEIKSDIS